MNFSNDRTVIIDYDAGNLRSVQRACAEVGCDALITGDPEVIQHSTRIIFPGVGAAGAAMRSIQAHGIDEVLLERYEQGVPILGICMGLQISLTHSEEDDQETIGLIEGQVKRFQIKDLSLKVPHMGWNEVTVVRPHPVLAHIHPGDEFYFVHAYYPHPKDESCVYGIATYETPFCCAVGRKNFFGTQFHPEKSGRIGLQLLASFFKWDGSIAE